MSNVMFLDHRRKIFFTWKRGKWRRNWMNIFKEKKILFAEEKEKEENNWRRKLYLLRRRKRTGM